MRRSGSMRQAPTEVRRGYLTDLETPALIVGQMPVQYIELVPGHPVDHRTDEGRRLKMTRRVQHQAAPGVSRRIADALRRDATRGGTRRQELPQGDGTVEEARRSAGGHRDPMRRHLELIGLQSKSVAVAELNRVRTPGASTDDRQRQPVGAGPQVNEIAGGRISGAVAPRHLDHGAGPDIERAGVRNDFGGKRNDTAPGRCERQRGAQKRVAACAATLRPRTILEPYRTIHTLLDRLVRRPDYAPTA